MSYPCLRKRLTGQGSELDSRAETDTFRGSFSSSVTMGSDGYQASTPARCQEMADTAFSRSSFVRFMVDKLAEAGCSVDSSIAKVHSCDDAVVGGFAPGTGVVLCHNHLGSQDEVNRSLTHELIHAYDHCRAADMDWTNCDHHACSEIRAANLSGDCHWSQEFLRGNWKLQKQHQECVRRRALLSVSMNPNCPGAKAEEAVDRMFATCFKDTAPFDRIP